MAPTVCNTSDTERSDSYRVRAITEAGRPPISDPDPGQALALARLVRPTDHWRLFADLRDTVRFIDIETLGLAPEDPITVVGISDGYGSNLLVRGVDLTRERLARLLDGAGLLVTFNGISFDVPRLKRAFPGLPWDLPHFDLAVQGRRIGLNGGLKRVERKLGFHRPRDLVGVDGMEAVRLWRSHCRGDAKALRRLMRYCRADVEALVQIADQLYARLLTQSREERNPDGWIERRP